MVRGLCAALGLVLCLTPDPSRADPAWWSLRPLNRPEVPPSTGAGARNPVDAFVRAKLAELGLAPSPEADRRTLIRRLTFDLHGLPPTPGEVAAFVNDPAPDAYERLVERLLASPAYGERWGRHWLDVVPYADTHGYDKDKRRDFAWPYRDYVIRALNADKSYGRFAREQIAGDVLFPGDGDAVVATGFVAAGPWDFVGHVELREGTVEKLKTRLTDRDDMLSNTISTFVSLTAHCARCHDHKFDPIAQEDYYALQAVFAGVERGNRPYPSAADRRERERLLREEQQVIDRQRQLQEKIAALTSPGLRAAEADLAAARARLAALPEPRARPGSPSNGYHSAIVPQPDAEKWVQLDLGESVPIDAVRIYPARPTDFRDAPGFGFPVRFKVAVSDDADFRTAETVADHTAHDFPNPGVTPVVFRAGGKRARFVRVTATRLWKRNDDYVFALAEMRVTSGGRDVTAGAKVTALDSIEAGRWGTRHLIDGHDSRHKLPDFSSPKVVRQLAERDAARERVAELERKREELHDALIDPATRSELARVRARLRELGERIDKVSEPRQVYAVVSRKPRPVRVLSRGDVTRPRREVGPGALACVPGPPADFSRLPGMEEEGNRRAALAEWIASPQNPLTWRSIANRVWQHHFGRGIVDTPNDFGRNGAPPTHPELLDWLACEVRDNGGSLKSLHRLIVTSATYRQVSAHDAANAKIDADNCFLWRQNRRRLDAEAVRDAVLAVSGKLDRRMGGPGFELFRFKDDHSPTYDHTDAAMNNRPEAWRRAVYRFVVRSVPHPLLECLDCADPNVSTPKRNETLTAPQALAMLNDAFLVRQAGFFAERLRREEPMPDGQVELGFRLALGRPPTEEEASALGAYAREHGLKNACRVLLNLNEFVFVD
ncbi:MAG TPA: DUF1553 domain-containing protein [Gemmataceae bacterium]